MTHAKLISSTQIDRNPPRSAMIGGALVVGQLPDDYLATLGYHPLTETAPSEPRTGYHNEARYEAVLDSDDNVVGIAQSWVEVENPPPPPRSLSKRKLMNALKAANLWTSVKSYMEANDVWDDFAMATTLDEDESLVQTAIGALKASIPLTDEQVESILGQSEAE